MMLMQEGAILEVDHVSKLYSRSPLESQRRMADIVSAAFWGRRYSVKELQAREFWALQNVTFSLGRSEAMGVIGLNGAGKTTLLRMLVGQFPPDEGEIRIAGKAAGMIDITAGFNTRLSGKENIYLRSATLGRSRDEVDALYDEIADFTELDDALVAPLSTYSAGMRMRLAFATTIFVDPRLLVIDEVLAVGDFRFRQKCLERVRALRANSAFVFASHSMNDIARFCDRVLVLEKGRIATIDTPDAAIKAYLDMQGRPRASSPHPAKAPAQRSKDDVWLDRYEPEPFVNEEVVRDLVFEINDEPPATMSLAHGEGVRIRVAARVARACRRLSFGVTILTREGGGVFGAASDSQGQALAFDGPQSVEAFVDMPSLLLNPGEYRLYFNIRDGLELILRKELAQFTIRRPEYNTWGVLTIPHQWTVAKADF
jgi:ABC-type polysaccharide/polyol phosphate transport system ATPase subunit